MVFVLGSLASAKGGVHFLTFAGFDCALASVEQVAWSILSRYKVERGNEDLAGPFGIGSRRA